MIVVGLHNDDQRVSVSVPFEVCVKSLGFGSPFTDVAQKEKVASVFFLCVL